MKTWVKGWGCCALLLLMTACPSRTGTQQGEGKRTVHERGSGPQARAFVIERADDLMQGESAEARVGDFRLENEDIAVLVGDVDHETGFGVSGGGILDAGLRQINRDGLKQVLLYLDDTFPRQARYTEVSVASPGGPGREAALEVVGHDTEDPRIKIKTRYTLPPEGRVLRLETTLTSPTLVKSFELGDALQWGASRPFAPGQGFELKGTRPSVPWLAAEAEGVSYGWTGQEAMMETIHGSGWSDANVRRVDLQPGQPVSFTRHLVIGEGSVASVLGPLLALRGVETLLVRGAVVDVETQEPVTDAWVDVFTQGEEPLHFARLRVDAQGAFAAPLPAGESYVARAATRGRLPAPVEGVPFKVTRESVVKLAVTPPGRLRYVLEDGQGRPAPGKLILVGRQGTPDPDLGPLDRAGLSGNRIYTLSGQGEAQVPPGQYVLYGARGPEFELASREVALKPGEVLEVKLKVRRVVDTSGWMAGDFHQHARPSSDSNTPLEDRVLSNIVEGVEIIGSSDHNVVTDYGPVIEAMGVSAVVTSMVGDEVTTTDRGHFNVYPLRPQAGAPSGGALSPAGMTPQAIFDALRARAPQEKIIQVNHPRSKDIGYFELMKVEPGTLKTDDARMSWDFDALEVFNGRWVKPALEVMEDWFAMLNRGGLFVAVGSSDTHQVVGDEPGYARTMIFVGTDDPQSVTEEAIVKALQARRAVVTNGPMIDASLDGVPIGGFLPPSPGGKGVLQVKVQAAPWVGVDQVEVIMNGEVVHTWEGLSGKVEPVRLQETFLVPIGEPGWVVVRATGGRSLAPVSPQSPGVLAFTNPIWIGTLVE